MILHTGTNDLRHQSAEITANTIINTTKILLSKDKTVIISKLLPREGAYLNEQVSKINTILEEKLKHHQNVQFTKTEGFYYRNQPNKDLYWTTYKDGIQSPLLHLNHKGLLELSRQIQNRIKLAIQHNLDHQGDRRQN